MSSSSLLGPQFQKKLRAAKQGDSNRPAKKVVDAVYDQLSEDYPAKALTWVHSMKWQGPKNVPLSQIDFEGDSDFLIAETQPEKVNLFRRRIKASEKKGEQIKPVIVIKRPSKKALAPDGHHRTLAYKELNKPVYAWVGSASSNRGPWIKLHDKQFKPDTGPQREGDKNENVYR